MIRVQWSGGAHRDLVRLYEFLAPLNEQAAHEAVREILGAVDRIAYSPGWGVRSMPTGPAKSSGWWLGSTNCATRSMAAGSPSWRLFHEREERGNTD